MALTSPPQPFPQLKLSLTVAGYKFLITMLNLSRVFSIFIFVFIIFRKTGTRLASHLPSRSGYWNSPKACALLPSLIGVVSQTRAKQDKAEVDCANFEVSAYNSDFGASNHSNSKTGILVDTPKWGLLVKRQFVYIFVICIVPEGLILMCSFTQNITTRNC